MPGAGTQQESIVLARRQQAANLYLQGQRQSGIAQTLGISQAQVSQDLKCIRAEWFASMLRDFDAAKAQELARVDAVEAEYWQAWARSQLPSEVSLTEAIEGGPGPRRKATLRKAGQYGDPRFLDGVLRCVERRCALLGLDAPTRFRVEWDKMTDAQLERLAAGESPQRVLMAEA